MLRFLVFDNAKPAESITLRNVHMLGSDGHGIWAEITFEDGQIVCRKRETGVAALALQWPAGDCGTVTLRTCVLPERDEPYLLNVELARHRLMMLYDKLEDWGMFDLPEDHPAMQRLVVARRLFIAALCAMGKDNIEADRLACDALSAAVDGSEELALAHSQVLLTRRRLNKALPERALGCGIELSQRSERVRAGVAANFEFVCLPTRWRDLAPAEGEYRWGQLDRWMGWASQANLPVEAGPIISFDPTVLPDWIYIWEDQYDQLRDVLYEHIERLVKRYRSMVRSWTVVSGLHVNEHLSFAFDQLLDLTRMAAMLVKKTAPAANVLIELQQPFGEYYSRNPRSIPPMMYVDLVMQSAIQVDGFSLELLMGQPIDGQYARDLMQISDLLDRFAGLGVPLHLKIACPSHPVDEMMIASPDLDTPVDPDSGAWRQTWSPVVQAHWLEAVIQIAMSKPFVDTVSWHEVADHPDIQVPLSGLVTEGLTPKTAFGRLVTLRRGMRAPVAQTAAPPNIDAAAPSDHDPADPG